MTLQERLRACCECEQAPLGPLLGEAADALDAKDARIKELEEVLREVDGLINYQYSGTRDAMSYLQHIANRVLEALK